MDFDEFMHQEKQGYVLQEGFAFRKIEAGQENDCRIALINVHSIMLVLKGEITIRIGDRPHLLTANCFVDTIDKLSIELSGPSEDFMAYHLLFTEIFLKSLLKNNPPFPLAYVLQKKEQPVSILNPPVVRILAQEMANIEAIFQNKTHYFRTEMLKCAVWVFFLDVSNAYLHDEDKADSQSQDTERKRILFKQFTELLQVHIREERSVNFYASKLKILSFTSLVTPLSS